MDLNNWAKAKGARSDPAELAKMSPAPDLALAIGSFPSEEQSEERSEEERSEERPEEQSEGQSEEQSEEQPEEQPEEQSEERPEEQPEPAKGADAQPENTTPRCQTPDIGSSWKRPHSATISSDYLSLLSPLPKRLRSAALPDLEPAEFVNEVIMDRRGPVLPVGPHACPGPDAEPPFTADTAQRLGRLTKTGLREAEVIAQVDNKYILTKMHGTTDGPMLVLIDQHAASERIRVEHLLRELCEGGSEEPPEPTQSVRKALTFSVSSRDAALLVRFRPEFERWAVGYTASPSTGTVSVHSLPRVARDRCEGEPFLAIELLRKHCYELEERGQQRPAAAPRGSSSDGGDDDDDDDGVWVERLSQIPKPLVEMANSRACRGALMFNDPLTMDECKTLVQRLAECKWPFMCAHGRVSMRPLVELAPVAPEIVEWESESERECGGRPFRAAFEKWRAGGFEGLSKGDA